MIVYGMEDTMRALEAGGLEQILIWENAEFVRMKLNNKDTDMKSVVYCKQEDVKNPKYFKDGIHGRFWIVFKYYNMDIVSN